MGTGRKQPLKKEHSGGMFVSNAHVHVGFVGHGYSTQTQHLRIVERPEDGTAFALTRNEWARMLSPLLRRDNEGNWTFGGIAVVLRKADTTGEQARQAERNARERERKLRVKAAKAGTAGHLAP